MRRTIAVALVIAGVHPIQARGEATDVRGNAALKYWQAFATLPTLSESETQLLDRGVLHIPLDDVTRTLVARASYSLTMLRHGAALPSCDWGIDYEEGVETRLPQGPAARVLCTLACLRARLRIEEGHPGEAVEDFAAALTLSRHLSENSGLIVLLFAYSLESRVSEALAGDLLRLDSDSTKSLQARLRTLPPGGRPAQMLEFEEKSLEWTVRRIKEAKDNESLVALLSVLVDDADGRRGQSRSALARKVLDECGGTSTSLRRQLEALRPIYGRMGRMLELTPDEFARGWSNEQARHAANAAFPMLFSAYPKIRQAQARAEVRRALLAAAIDVRIRGREAVLSHHDPADADRPLEYLPAGRGYQVRSRLKGADGKPLSLIVGE
jgi:hypothetical protein